MRALIATWHRKIDSDVHPESTLIALAEILSTATPMYHLPPITRAHTRHYMPVGGSPALVFDGFARIDPEAALVVSWPGVVLGDGERALLQALVQRLGYLGRAESWVEAELLTDYDGPFNCVSVNGASATVDPTLEPVRLLMPKRPAEYAQWRMRMLDELGLNAKRLTKTQQRACELLPERFIDALCIDTTSMRDGGWNMPPAAESVTFCRPPIVVAPIPRRRPVRHAAPTTVRLALAGKPLPRIEDAVLIGETTRASVIQRWDRLFPGTAIPAVISGHSDVPADHGHAFYLPEDADDDGFIDHVLIYAAGGLSADAVRAIASVSRLWAGNRGDWRVVFEGAWCDPIESKSRYAARADAWISSRHTCTRGFASGVLEWANNSAASASSAGSK